MAADPKFWPTTLARDLMKTHVVTVPETATLAEAVRRLAENRVSGLPVTDEAGHVSGVLSIRDILDYESEEGGTRIATMRGFYAETDNLDDDYEFGEIEVDEDSSATVADVMTAEVFAVNVDTKLHDIAKTLVEHRIHRVLVDEDGKHVGIISAMDVLTALVGG